MSSKYVIIDCGLDMGQGHHLSHLKVALNGLDADASDITLLTNNAVNQDSIDGVRVIADLKSTGYEAFQNPDVAEERRSVETLGLGFLKRDALLAQADKILVFNVTPNVLAGLLLWMQYRGRPLSNRLCLYMLCGVGVERRLGPLFVETDKDRTALIRKAVATCLARASKTTWYVTSPMRRQELRKLGAHPIALYSHYSDPVCAHTSAKTKRPSHVLLSVGDARPSKGTNRLPELTDRCLAEFPNLRFAAHVNDGARGFEHVTQRLKALANTRDKLKVTFGRLSGPEYQSLLTAAELVILDQSPDYYHDMESGLANDCVRLKVPFLIPDGTLTARMLTACGGENFVFDGRRDLMTKLGKFLEDISATQRDFETVANRYVTMLEYPPV